MNQQGLIEVKMESHQLNKVFTDICNPAEYIFVLARKICEAYNNIVIEVFEVVFFFFFLSV